MSKNTYKSSIISIAAGISISVLILLVFSPQPAAAALDFISGTFTSSYYFGSFLNTAALLMFAGTGAAVALKSGNLNLGGEGQIYAGGFIAAILLRSASCSAAMLIPAFIAAAAAGALQVLVSALLRKFKKANILLTSFLISAAIIPCIDSLIAGSFRSQTGNLLATAFISPNVRFLQILRPSPLNVSFFAAPAVCILCYFIIFKTNAGRKLQIWGTAPEFARCCGYSETKALFFPLIFSGVMNGLTGAAAVCGTYYTCHTGFYSGMGWNALSCALIAQSNPLMLIPASLILSWLYTSTGRVSLMQGLPFDISSLIQGIILFCISIHYISRRRRT